MKSLFILNHPPYGTERCHNALRLVTAILKKDPGSEVVLFLMADAEGRPEDHAWLLQHRAHAEAPADRQWSRFSCAEPAWMRVA